MKKIERYKDLFIVEYFLTSEECDYYINFGNSIGFEEAKIGVEGAQVMNKEVRNNDRLLFFDQAFSDKLRERIQPFLPKKMESITH
ncbi:hypothetical protein [Winogradskyella sp. PC D3.3]